MHLCSRFDLATAAFVAAALLPHGAFATDLRNPKPVYSYSICNVQLLDRQCKVLDRYSIPKYTLETVTEESGREWILQVDGNCKATVYRGQKPKGIEIRGCTDQVYRENNKMCPRQKKEGFVAGVATCFNLGRASR